MKRFLLWTLWAAIPAGALAFHYGPGKEYLARDKAAEHLKAAMLAEANEDFETAANEYASASAALPEAEHTSKLKLNLAEAKAKLNGGRMIEGANQLEELIAAEDARPDANKALLKEFRDEAGTASYHIGWLMRLEGATEDEWKPETENARQHFRFLSEEGEKAKDADAETFKKNLEAVIRLEQMGLDELRALPLPKKCNGNCKGLGQKKREQRLSKCNKPGNKEDARKEIKSDSAANAKNGGGGS